MKKIKSYFEKSNKGILFIIILVLFSFYGFTISNFLAGGPSKGFSREIEIGQVRSGKEINNKSQVETLLISDEEALIIAVDNDQLKLIKISILGEVIEEEIVDINLYNATNISVSVDSEGLLSLYYLEDDLYRVLINLESLEYKRLKVADDVDYFIKDGQMIVFQHESGLYGINVEDHTIALPLIEGPIKSFALDQDDSTGIYHLIATIRSTLAVDISYVQFNDQLNIEKKSLLRDDSSNTYLQYIKAIHVEDNVLTGIYVWSDIQYGESNITVHQYDTDSLVLITDYLRDFTLIRSRYIITDVKDDQVTLLFQESVHSGINLVEVLMSSDGVSEIKPLTRTRKTSMFSKYFEFGEDQGLVFFDLVDGKKIIYYASSNPTLIEMTTKLTTINPIRIVGIFFIIIVLAAVFSAVYYLTFVAVGPFITLLLMNKYLPDFKSKPILQTTISAIIHIGLKLYLTYYIIYVVGTYTLTPPIIGKEPYIYLAMVFLSIISYFQMTRSIKWNIQYDATAIQSYLYFLFFEYVNYTLLVFIYIVTNMIIGKI